MMPELFPVILAGGSGTRLWPLSRKNFPKQFLCLQSESSLLQQTMHRVMSLPYADIILLSNEAHYFLCQEQLQSFDQGITYLLEPCTRNTAPAIAAAAHYMMRNASPDALMMILPSDHWIGDENIWRTALLQGAQLASLEPVLVTFGIKPNSPKTGYGYIEAAHPKAKNNIFHVQGFREKPDAKTAETFLTNDNYYWNSGMFICRAKTYLDELKQHAPDIFTSTEQAVLNGTHHHNYLRLDAKAFEQCRDESIDYAVMEKTDRARLIPLDTPWSDLGCWRAVAEAHSLDEHGNALHGNVMAKDSQDCLISSEKTLITTLGIRDQIIVATDDAVLVADKRYSQQVKDIVSALGKDHHQLLHEHHRVSRPWGYYEVLAEGPTFKVKQLMLKPGAKLSLQMHQYRAEHWVVVDGTAEVVNDEQMMKLQVNQSTYIPPKTRHRLSNPGQEPLHVIEVQSGHYLGEDDIIRFDDAYHRETEPAGC